MFLLGRLLMKIGEEAMPQPPAATPRTGSTRIVLIVLSDVVAHDSSSIGEIADRTGLPQSQVSAAVARLKEAGSVETQPDPADRRRMLVRKAATTSARVTDVRVATIDDALAAALGTADTADITDTVQLLETLAARLLPN